MPRTASIALRISAALKPRSTSSLAALTLIRSWNVNIGLPPRFTDGPTNPTWAQYRSLLSAMSRIFAAPP